MASVTGTTPLREWFLDGRDGDFEVAIERGEVSSPRSVKLVMLGLGACTVAAVQHYMTRKGMLLDGLSVEVTAKSALRPIRTKASRSRRRWGTVPAKPIGKCCWGPLNLATSTKL